MARKESEIFFKDLLVNSEQPIYYQMYDALRSAIINGRLLAGEKLPATRSIAKFCQVSRTTVQTAFDLLLAEGYITGKTGSGTFVHNKLPESYFTAKKLVSLPQSKDPGFPEFSSLGKRISESPFQNITHKNILPFQPGIPSFSDFPYNIWSKIAFKSVKDLSNEQMGYTDPAGLLQLRESIALYLRQSRGVKCSAGQIVIINGSQQGLSLVSKIFLNNKSEIILEDPVYPGAYVSFKTSGAKISFVAVDKEGIDVNTITKSKAKPKLVYTTPSHQYPLGVSLSLKRRFLLLEWAAKNSAIIIEDDYDSEFRYTGNPFSSLQGMTEYGNVIYIGTFSKVLYPGIRLGYIVLPEKLVEVFSKAKAIEDRNSPMLEQLVLSRFIEDGHFGRHLRKMRLSYQERQESLLYEFKKSLSGIGDIRFSPAGLHLVTHLKKEFTDQTIYKKALKKNIIVQPLSMYSMKRKDLNGLVMGFSAYNPDLIKRSINKLSSLF